MGDMKFREARRESALALYAERLHARTERGGLDTEQLRRTVVAGYFPIGALQCGENVIAFQVFEFLGRAHALGGNPVARARSRPCPRTVRQRAVEIEPPVTRCDHRPLYNVLQLAHITRPIVGLEPAQTFVGQRLKRPSHALGNLLRKPGRPSVNTVPTIYRV